MEVIEEPETVKKRKKKERKNIREIAVDNASNKHTEKV